MISKIYMIVISLFLNADVMLELSGSSSGSKIVPSKRALLPGIVVEILFVSKRL